MPTRCTRRLIHILLDHNFNRVCLTEQTFPLDFAVKARIASSAVPLQLVMWTTAAACTATTRFKFAMRTAIALHTALLQSPMAAATADFTIFLQLPMRAPVTYGALSWKLPVGALYALNATLLHFSMGAA